MKRILFVGMNTAPAGGVEAYMMNIFLRLEGPKYHFTFTDIYSHNNIACYEEILKHGGSVVKLHLNNNIYGFFSRYYKVLNFLKSHKFDIIHVNALSLNELYWIKAAKKVGIKKLIFQSHNSNRYRKSLLVRFFDFIIRENNQLYLFFNKDIIELAVSDDSGKWMFNNSRYKIIYNGINTDTYKYNSFVNKNIRSRLNLNNNSVIITTSRIEPQKNYPKIINIFNHINHLDKNIKLIIIGIGSQYKLVKSMVSSYNLNNFVIFLGERNHKFISKLLNVANLMIMPSIYEGMPFSLIEAQASGVPALVSLEGIPKRANVTDRVKYLSLKESDSKWALLSLKILNNKLSKKNKLYMNEELKKSNFNLNVMIKEISKIYSR